MTHVLVVTGPFVRIMTLAEYTKLDEKELAGSLVKFLTRKEAIEARAAWKAQAN